MKIIHCADLHLSSTLGKLDTGKRKERNIELLKNFTDLCDYAKTKGVKVILIAGDLFDTNNVAKTVQNTVAGVIKNCPEIDFYYLKGNHDSESFLADADSMPDNIHLFGENWKTYELYGGDNWKITLTGKELLTEEKPEIYNALKLQSNDFNIVTLHGQIEGTKSRSKAETINLPYLTYKNIDYLALGHVHKIQVGELKPRGEYCYAGCLEGRGYDEEGEHGFMLLDIDETSRKMTRTFVPFAKRIIRIDNVDVSDCGSSYNIINKLKNSYNGKFSNDYVKIILTGDVSVDADINTDYILSEIKDWFYDSKVENNTKLYVDYRSFENDNTLKGEFVRQIKKDDSLTEEEKGEIIKCGLGVLSNTYKKGDYNI